MHPDQRNSNRQGKLLSVLLGIKSLFKFWPGVRIELLLAVMLEAHIVVRIAPQHR